MMNLPGLLLRAQCHRTVVFSWSSVGLSRRPSASRGYATQRSGFDASSLPHSLDTKTNILGGRQAGRDSVGPFQLGGSQSFGDEKVKKWAELSTSGKGMSRRFECGYLEILTFYSAKNHRSDHELCCYNPWSWAFSGANLLFNL